MIDLYSWSTPNGRKISIALEELNLGYTLHPVDISKGEQFSAEFLAMNPNNKIPVIRDSDGVDGHPVTLFESGAILVYLADKARRLLPVAGRARYETIQWLMFQMGGVGPMFGQTHHFQRYAAHEKYSLERYTTETHRLYKVLDGQLAKNEFVGGDAYSIADIAIYPWVARFGLHQIDLASVPHVKRWYDTLGERPAVQRGMEVL
ncbi:glutathione S-transferase N-terminal domain-containing protein [Cupriavidus pinatubonensis]|uniref:glutathione S-transferase N-terminal domain-containing protein n=1 Tax=Cupriavidus pinatubonensis TaxID=248026 RepID=UPI00112A8040|nr:glutathione S-transferase N-terminal domain-containing protein [Cupriavidus pinatubonensis]TPQ39139.1 glutathione S-transferase [Cupriavidus pinatubonensis]